MLAKAPSVPPHYRVALVEDHPIVRAMLQSQVESLGMTCAAIDSAEEALRMIEERMEPAFDVLLTDLEFRGMSGTEMIWRIRSSATPAIRDLPIIAISAAKASEASHRLSDLRISGFLPKPVSRADLESAIHSALRPGACDPPDAQTLGRGI